MTIFIYRNFYSGKIREFACLFGDKAHVTLGEKVLSCFLRLYWNLSSWSLDDWKCRLHGSPKLKLQFCAHNRCTTDEQRILVQPRNWFQTSYPDSDFHIQTSDLSGFPMYLNHSVIYLCVSGYDYILLLFVGGSAKAHFLPGFLIFFKPLSGSTRTSQYITTEANSESTVGTVFSTGM